MIERVKRILILSGIVQLGGVVCYLLLPCFLYETKNYPTRQIRGWQVLSGYVGKTEMLTDAGEALGASLLLFFVCACVLVLAGAAGAVMAVTGKIPPLVPALLTLADLAAAAVPFAYIWGKTDGTDYHLGSSFPVCAGCFFVAAVFGFIAVGVRAAGNRRAAETAAAAQMKMPDVSEQIEQKKYYQVVEQETAPADAAGAAYPPYMPGSAPRGVMVGLAGVYAGIEIPFQPGETIRIGRDASSNLIYDKRAPRVSRHHCEITWMPENAGYSIVDTSTNGTFKNGSDDCLPQNMRIALEVGCTISLGSEDNVFRLE